MRTLGKSIIVHRGETFVLTRKVLKDDGVTPFVLSMSIVNPYLIITVSSSTYRVNGGYRANFWLDLSKYPAFRSVTPVLIDRGSIEDGVLPENYNPDGRDCVFYVQNLDGNKQFYYYDKGVYLPYSFVFTKLFLNVHTKDWIESQYQYEFKLVGGEKMLPKLQSMYKGIYPYARFVPTDTRTLYYEIKKCRPDLVRGLQYSAPLANYFVENILQRPEKLIIKANC